MMSMDGIDEWDVNYETLWSKREAIDLYVWAHDGRQGEGIWVQE